MRNFLKVAITVCGLIAFTSANAQVPISFAGQIGYASPQGSWFKGEDGEKSSKFGIGIDFDILYHLEQFENKLGVGVTYNSSFLFSTADGIGLYGLGLYGVKGHYRFFNSTCSPYGALSLGLGHFATPEITMTDWDGNETVVAKSENAFSFGIRPEIGVELGGFIISAGFIIPMKYSLYDVKNSAGALQINIGYRYCLFDRN